jgi:hypothetical protein
VNFAVVTQLTEDFYAPGFLGSFNLQLRVSAQNNSNTDWAANTAELIIMPMNCGVLVNEKGTSSTFTALLSGCAGCPGTASLQPGRIYQNGGRWLLG